MVASTFEIKYPETTNLKFVDGLSPSVTNVIVNSAGLTLNDASGQTVVAASQITTPIIQPEQILDSTGAAGAAGQVVGSDASGNTVWLSINEVQNISAVLSNGTDANFQEITNLVKVGLSDPTKHPGALLTVDPSEVRINETVEIQDVSVIVNSTIINDKSIDINVTGANDVASKISITNTNSNYAIPSNATLNSNSLSISGSDNATDKPFVRISNSLDATSTTGFFCGMSVYQGDDSAVLTAGYYDTTTPANSYRISAGVNNEISPSCPSIAAYDGNNNLLPVTLGTTVSIMGPDSGVVSLSEADGVLSISTPLDSTSGRTLVPYYLPIISADQSQTFYIQLWQ